MDCGFALGERGQATRRSTERERQDGKPPYRYRFVRPIIVAPLDFLRAERIIDYDGDVSAKLIEEGFRAAKYAFEKAFPDSPS